MSMSTILDMKSLKSLWDITGGGVMVRGNVAKGSNSQQRFLGLAYGVRHHSCTF